MGMRLKNIFVTNDDGITARGIHVLAKALSGIADVYVCAPDRQRTAAGHGITVSEKLYVVEAPFEEAKKAYSCSGTPADCVKLGLEVFRSQGIEIDLVCSGINHGANLGTDVLYSGTVSAALEGVICGVPSIAFSSCSHQPEHLEVYDRFAAQVCRAVWGKLDNNTVLNVNAPDLPAEEIRGVKFVRQGIREYENTFDPAADEEGKTYYEYSSKPAVYEDLPADMDVMASQDHYITVTPLQYDLTNHRMIDEVAGWGIEFQR